MTDAPSSSDLRDALRQMLAVLEEERQALAGLDIDAIVGTTRDKNHLCGMIERFGAGQTPELDEECSSILDTARRLNEVNRQVRNIIAANVSRRLNALTGSLQLYRIPKGYAAMGR